VRSLDLPDQPDEPGRAEHAGATGRDRPTPKLHEVPDPDERGRVYEATRAHVSAETNDGIEQGQRPDEAEKSSYWSEVPRFQVMWADHEKRWPEREPSAGPDRPEESPGTYRSRGGFELSPERHAEANEAIGRVREAEPSISADLQTIEKENGYGGWLEGFKNRRKGEDRLKEKIAEQLEAESSESAANVLRRIPDALRYTYCFEPDNYTRGYYDIKARMESFGHEMYQSTNYWSDPEYKGINMRWVTRQGQRFEVQVHTPESFHAKQHVTHKAYERIRDLTTSRPELRELHEIQRKVSAWVPIPNGAADIPDLKKEGF
jgi:virulence-associated protein VapD